MFARLRGSLRDFDRVPSRQRTEKGWIAREKARTYISPSNRLTSSTVHPSGFRTLAMMLSESGCRSVMERTGGDVTNAHAALACPESGA